MRTRKPKAPGLKPIQRLDVISQSNILQASKVAETNTLRQIHGRFAGVRAKPSSDLRNQGANRAPRLMPQRAQSTPTLATRKWTDINAASEMAQKRVNSAWRSGLFLGHSQKKIYIPSFRVPECFHTLSLKASSCSVTTNPTEMLRQELTSEWYRPETAG
jgi:hypothetical protein